MVNISMASNYSFSNFAISLRAVHKLFGELHVVDGVDLDIQCGEIFGLIGHNGAGKSTLFKLMLGLINASQGEISLGGISVQDASFRSVRRNFGYLPENIVLYDHLNAMETLQFFARLKGAPLSQCQIALERVGLSHVGKRQVHEFSKGMRQRLGFAQALLGSPKVLFLDEPTNGLDPQAIRDFYAILQQLKDDGATIVITSHILAELQERVDRLAILSSGKIQAVGSIKDLRDQMNMPLSISLTLAQQDQMAAINVLATLPNIEVKPVEQGLQLTCSRDCKINVLRVVSSIGANLLDIQIQEPSLEDVYFGLR